MNDEQKTINWTRPKLERFKRVYAKAVQDKVEAFDFEDCEFIPDYAKYLIQYLDSKLT